MTDEELREIRVRLQHITKGQWKFEMDRLTPPRPEIWCHKEDGSKTLICHAHAIMVSMKQKEENINFGPDMDFILHSPIDQQNLLEEVTTLRARVKELEGKV